MYVQLVIIDSTFQIVLFYIAGFAILPRIFWKRAFSQSGGYTYIIEGWKDLKKKHPKLTVFQIHVCIKRDLLFVRELQVSGDCEVLAINKKFFLRHCDDAMYSLIRLKVTAVLSPPLQVVKLSWGLMGIVVDMVTICNVFSGKALSPTKRTGRSFGHYLAVGRIQTRNIERLPQETNKKTLNMSYY